MNIFKRRRATLIEALRSGEYKQTQQCLRRNDSYCCLGVACDLYARDPGNHGEWLMRNYGQATHVFMINLRSAATSMLPDDVRAYYGFKHVQGKFEGLGLSLASENDTGATFEQIADIIEQEPEGLCVDEPDEPDGPEGPEAYEPASF